jgi:hypothetical protein
MAKALSKIGVQKRKHGVAQSDRRQRRASARRQRRRLMEKYENNGNMAYQSMWR